MRPFEPLPICLVGQHVRLEPLAPEHAANLLEAGADPAVWRYMTTPPLRDLAEVEQWIAAAQREVATGTTVAFAIVQRATGRAIGSTRYLDIRSTDRALEIGWTWIGSAWQRTVVNSECKYLLLRHAFEGLGALRVQLKTDGRNLRSQRAIERIGAKREGVLRKQRINWDGYVRDAVYYSVIDDEWPEIRDRLETLLAGVR